MYFETGKDSLVDRRRHLKTWPDACVRLLMCRDIQPHRARETPASFSLQLPTEMMQRRGKATRLFPWSAAHHLSIQSVFCLQSCEAPGNFPVCRHVRTRPRPHFLEKRPREKKHCLSAKTEKKQTERERDRKREGKKERRLTTRGEESDERD